MKHLAPAMNRAVSLIGMLRAYCPRVKLAKDEGTLVKAQETAKRRTRPLTGRGNYGKNLMAHFDSKGINWSSKKRRGAK